MARWSEARPAFSCSAKNDSASRMISVRTSGFAAFKVTASFRRSSSVMDIMPMLPDEPETGHKRPQNDNETKRIEEQREREERRQREMEEDQRRNKQKRD